MALTINFTSVAVDDQDRALAFYTKTLGFTEDTDNPYEDSWRWIFLAPPGGGTKLHFARRAELTWKPGMPVLALVSDDVDAEASALAAKGVEITMPPQDAPWGVGRFMLIKDSEENTIILQSGTEALSLIHI